MLSMTEEELAVFLKEDLWLQTITVRPQGYKRQQNNKINNSNARAKNNLHFYPNVADH